MHKRTLVAIFAIVAVLASLSTSNAQQTPGSLKFFIQNSGIEKIQSIVNPLLISFLENTTLPDVTWSSLGIHLNLSSIHFSKFDFGQQTVTLVEPDQIVLSMTSLSLITLMDWSYTDGPAINWSGWAEDDISSTNVKIVLIVGSDAAGHATLRIDSAEVDIGTLNIQLHGSGGQFFEDIAKLITPLIKKAVESGVSNNMATGLSQIAAKLFATIPIEVPLIYGTEMYYGLIATHAQRGLNGSLYAHSCIFDGSAQPVTLTDFNSFHLSNYESFDVSGFFRPPVSGSFVFQIAFTQRGQLDVAGQSVGSLEPHNPGMCWPEHHSYSTGAVALDASTYYPVRLRYQAGCGGGSVTVNLCDSSAQNCSPLSALLVSTAPANEFPITVWPTGIEVVSDAEAYVSASPHEAPLARTQLPDSLATGMLGIFLDQFVINSVGYAMYEAGEFSLVVTDKEIPATAPFHLNTTSFQGLIPDLYAQYPNDLMQLLLTMAAPPAISVSPSGVSATVPVQCNVSVVDSTQGGALVPVMSWLLTLNSNATIGVTGGSVTGEISFLSCGMELLWADVNVTAGPLQGLINFIASRLVVPQLNAKLATGFPLPVVQGVSLVNSQVTYEAGFVSIATDFDYTPKHRDLDGEVDVKCDSGRVSAIPVY